MSASMERKQEITRIDFAIAGEQVVVNKIDDVTTMGRGIPVDSSRKPKSELDTMLAWCEQHGWIVRRYLPLGARAWKGTEPRPVRHEGQVIKKRRELTQYPVEGLQLHALDLKYDC